VSEQRYRVHQIEFRIAVGQCVFSLFEFARRVVVRIVDVGVRNFEIWMRHVGRSGKNLSPTKGCQGPRSFRRWISIQSEDVHGDLVHNRVRAHFSEAGRA